MRISRSNAGVVAGAIGGLAVFREALSDEEIAAMSASESVNGIGG